MLNSTYRVRKRAASEDTPTPVKRPRTTASTGAAKLKAQAECVDNVSPVVAPRGLGVAAATPGRPPLHRTGSVLMTGQKAPATEVLGSRKSARPGKTPLPAKYDVLLQLFGALQMVCRVSQLRCQHCIFQAVRKDVELQSCRRFTVQHLAQMQAVYPEVLTLSYVNIPKSAAHSQNHCSGTQLLIELAVTDTAASGSNASNSDSPCVSSVSKVVGQVEQGSKGVPHPGAGVAGSPGANMHMTAIRAEFERRLEKQVLSHYKDFLESHGKPEVAPTCVAAGQWDEGFDVEALPDIQPAEMPKPASTAKAVSGTHKVDMACRTPGTTGQMSSETRAVAPGSRRLSFSGCAGDAAEQDSARDSHAAQLSEEQLVQKLPEQVQQQFLDGELPISLNSLQALHKHEVHQALMFSPEAKVARRRSAATAQLPHVFDALRASFGPSGPCVRPYDTVVKQLTNSNKGATTASDVEDQLASLASAAPEWLTIETDLVGKQIVRLQRRVNSKAIRQRLSGLAGRRAGGGSGLRQ